MKPGRITFSIPGEPKGKGRPRAVPGIKTGDDGEPVAFVRLVTPDDTRKAEGRVRDAFRAAHPNHKLWTGAVQINFTAVFETPASFNRALKDAAARGELYATKKPDKDNIEKMIVDALNGIAWVDDAQVMGGGIKRYGSPARIDVALLPLNSPDAPATPGQKRAEARLQGTLPLNPKKALRANPTKSVSDSPRVAPDLSMYDDRTRGLIEAAMAREEASRRDRKR